ncbi:TSC complex subunit 1a isoform X2 [Echeneis naucrates]|uniref:TSC complex subunit 1a isoform X2 n=1 Tax=Echeneis naucrates TaxID=173247 RepID=UPI0011139299|nr:hamartin-like isoform X2 [Echeneis naucrates]
MGPSHQPFGPAAVPAALPQEGNVVVLITAVLVLIILLPMIPQAGKQHIYDFFDVFGRLASWSYRNPGHVPVVHLVHLHAGVYSLFHRLYGMFPCNFISYLRLHYSMKENLDTFQEVVKPMLEHVRVHPELITGTQDYELDMSRWRCYEVHDIVIECSRLSLDPLEASCEEDMSSPLRDSPSSSPGPARLSSPLPVLDLTFSPVTESISGSGGLVSPSLSGCLTLPQLTFNTSWTQGDDVTWSPSSQCGMSTPPSEPAASPLSGFPSTSGVKCPSPASVNVMPLTEENKCGGLTPVNTNQVPIIELEGSSCQPFTEGEKRGHRDDIKYKCEEGRSVEAHLPPTSSSSKPLSHPISTPTHRPEVGGSCLLNPTHCDQSPGPHYECLFDLALPRATALFIRRKTQDVLDEAGWQGERGRMEGKDKGDDQTSVSPLEVLDQLIVHGQSAHEGLSRKLSGVSKSVDRTHVGDKQQSMKSSKGPAFGEELQSLRSQLLLLHSQLQYERFKRQQHAIRNRRLLRRVINTTALEEHVVAMRAQLGVQEEEIRCLKLSLEEEQRQFTQLQQDTQTHTSQLHTHIQQLLLQQQDDQRDNQRLQSELQECQGRLSDLEAELQKANNKAYNAEHQLTQLSLKVCSSEQLQQQIFLLDQQIVLLRDTNRVLVGQLDGGDTSHCTEASMLQCSVGKEYQRLKDSEVQLRQKLEAANHRIAELETQLAKRDQLALDQKKLLEDNKAQSRAELSACESCCVTLRRLTQTLQTEMLHLYSQIHLDACSRPNSGSVALPFAQDSVTGRPPSSSVGIINGAMGALSTSPLHLPSCSSSPLSLSPIDSPLTVGSFLEQRARQLFKPSDHGQEEEEPQEEEDAQLESPLLGQEAEEAAILSGSPETESQRQAAAPGLASPPPDLTLAVQQRRRELSIMDYNETLPEY